MDARIFSTGLVELYTIVAHHELIGLEIGPGQRLADLFRLSRTGAVDGFSESEEALHVAATRIVEVAAGLGLVHVVDLVRRGAGLADVPGAAVHRTLRNVRNGRNEGWIGEAGVVADYHRWKIIQVLHSLYVKDRVRCVADEDRHVGLLFLELKHLRGDIRRACAIGYADRDRHVARSRGGLDRVGN